MDSVDRKEIERQIAQVKGMLSTIRSALDSAMGSIANIETLIDVVEQTDSHVAHMIDSYLEKSQQIAAVTPTPAAPAELIINDEWRDMLALLDTGENMLITGGAGTGKSTLLNHFLDNADRNVAAVAPTGVAALRVNGETIHRFFQFGAHALQDDDIQKLSDSRSEKYRALDTLVIDEISMVRADMMDAIDRFLRLNGRHHNQIFGGCQVVMVGDLFQLPPVSKEKDEKAWLTRRYGVDTPYFFHANVWRDQRLNHQVLTTIFRQSDPEFVAALNAIRSGEALPKHLALINQQYAPTFRPRPDELWITLTTTNASAEASNRTMLAALPGEPETFLADISGDFDLKNAPTDERLELKPGAAVMFIKNNADHHWVNGTLGRVESIKPLRVSVSGVLHEVEREEWEQIVYEFDHKKNRLTKSVRGSFRQIPLRLASAITIHKSQGLTLDRVIIDMNFGAFAAGQTYVALSRARSLQGLRLRTRLAERDLIVNTEVQRFMRGQTISRPAAIMPDLPLFDSL